MEFCRNNLRIGLLFIIIGYVTSNPNTEKINRELLKGIPHHFQAGGPNAKAKITKYIDEIQAVVKRNNMTAVFKVNVDMLSSGQPKKSKPKRKKSKKYNVPLKKESMKLSTYEMVMRRLADEAERKKQYLTESIKTTKKGILIITTKQPFLGKYKPIISRVKSNFPKVIKPVRNKEIILEMKTLKL